MILLSFFLAGALASIQFPTAKADIIVAGPNSFEINASNTTDSYVTGSPFNYHTFDCEVQPQINLHGNFINSGYEFQLLFCNRTVNTISGVALDFMANGTYPYSLSVMSFTNLTSSSPSLINSGSQHGIGYYSYGAGAATQIRRSFEQLNTFYSYSWNISVIYDGSTISVYTNYATQGSGSENLLYQMNIHNFVLYDVGANVWYTGASQITASGSVWVATHSSVSSIGGGSGNPNTFGNTHGGSDFTDAYAIGYGLVLCNFTTPLIIQNLTQISFFTGYISSPINMTACVYANNNGQPYGNVLFTSNKVLISNMVPQWINFTFNNPIGTGINNSGAKYWFGVFANGDYDVKYDSVNGYAIYSITDSSISYPTFPNLPDGTSFNFLVNSGSTDYSELSIYMQYDTANYIGGLISGINFLSDGNGLLHWVVTQSPGNNGFSDIGASGGLGYFTQFIANDVISVTAIPNTGFKFSYFLVNGYQSYPTSPLSFSYIGDNASVQVVFAVSSGSTGGSGSGTLSSGDVITNLAAGQNFVYTFLVPFIIILAPGLILAMYLGLSGFLGGTVLGVALGVVAGIIPPWLIIVACFILFAMMMLRSRNTGGGIPENPE